LAFTRNPFLLVVMLLHYFIKHRRNLKGFRDFTKNSTQPTAGFARSRPTRREGEPDMRCAKAKGWLLAWVLLLGADRALAQD
jgi:hypothetical protein